MSTAQPMPHAPFQRVPTPAVTQSSRAPSNIMPRPPLLERSERSGGHDGCDLHLPQSSAMTTERGCTRKQVGVRARSRSAWSHSWCETAVTCVSSVALGRRIGDYSCW